MTSSVGKKTVILGILIVVVVFASMVYPHCQIPCGIYGDPARFDMIAENITAIEKSMKLIADLSQTDNPNFNQIVRWVQNKEKHADDTSHIITYYFMAQRVKPALKTDSQEYDEYVKKLTLLHKMLVYTMKTKQTTDLANVEKLRSLLAKFQDVYFGKSNQSQRDHSGHEHLQ